jgi:hypothetical protein
MDYLTFGPGHSHLSSATTQAHPQDGGNPWSLQRHLATPRHAKKLAAAIRKARLKDVNNAKVNDIKPKDVQPTPSATRRTSPNRR